MKDGRALFMKYTLTDNKDDLIQSCCQGYADAFNSFGFCIDDFTED